MNFKEFRNSVLTAIENRPKHYRKGQAAFNFIEEKYKVARTVQLCRGVDCFYDDDQIEQFIKLSYEYYEASNRDDKSQ